MSHDTTPSPGDIQFALQEVRTLLLQQILTADTGLLSVAELVYRNRGEDDINEENIRYHLREMDERDIVSKEKVPSGRRVRDLPTTFFRVTDYGEAILEQANLLAESELWAEMYEQMGRTERIDRIEQLKRQTWTQSPETAVDDPRVGTSSEPETETAAEVVGDSRLTDEVRKVASTRPEGDGSDTSSEVSRDSSTTDSEDGGLVATTRDDSSETDESR